MMRTLLLTVLLAIPALADFRADSWPSLTTNITIQVAGTNVFHARIPGELPVGDNPVKTNIVTFSFPGKTARFESARRNVTNQNEMVVKIEPLKYYDFRFIPIDGDTNRYTVRWTVRTEQRLDIE